LFDAAAKAPVCSNPRFALSRAVLEPEQPGRYDQRQAGDQNEPFLPEQEIGKRRHAVKTLLTDDFSGAEIEAGRRLFAGEWNFVSAASSLGSLPPMAGPEIAFAGRSNVGKSSLINALTGRRALARTSNTPGRTQELIFFAGPHRLVLVDMPGYGYAATAKSKVIAWTRLIHEYLHGRATLARVYVLIDARHGLKTADDGILDTLSRAAVSHEIVLTKTDQISEDLLAERIEAVRAAVSKRAAAYPGLIATSAKSGAGVARLRAAVARLLAERVR
jgi:GTP-binding protein